MSRKMNEGMLGQVEKQLQPSERRRRLHELIVALIQQQEDLELLDPEKISLEGSKGSLDVQEPARWLDRNRRTLQQYQALVRSAVTLDALLDAESN